MLREIPQQERYEWLCDCKEWHPDICIGHMFGIPAFQQAQAKERRKARA